MFELTGQEEINPILSSFPFRYLKHDLVQNALALYGVQACRKLFPLISIPYLARILQPVGWGRYALMGALGDVLVLVIEFGFNLSATREIARHRDSRETCGSIMSSVFGVQLGLSVIGVTGALAAAYMLPGFHDDRRMLAAALFYGVAQGLNPLWFFQGLERIRLASTLEITGKALSLLSIFVFVHYSSDGWKVLLIQAAAPVLSTVAGLFLAWRSFPLRLPSRRRMVEAFRGGWNLFLFRSGESLYGAGNALILGLFAPASSVGYFAAAERLSRASFGLMNPIRDTLYPRLSNLAKHSADKAASLAKVGAYLMIGGGVILAVLIWICAPLMVRLLMGPGFDQAIGTLRILALLPPLLSVTYSMGLQWLIPAGRDREVNRIILSAGFLNIILAVLLAPRFAHVGMAWSVVAAETWVAVCMFYTVWKSTAFGSSPAAEPIRVAVVP